MIYKFQVPTPTGPHDFTILSGASLIFVGANGGGKTRLAVQIEQSNLDNVHRISAHRSLALDPAAPKIAERLAKKGLKFGYAAEDSGSRHKGSNRWGSNWATHLLKDFDFVVQGLFAEQSNTALVTHNAAHAGSIEPPLRTKFQTLISIWQRLLPHRELIVTGDDVNVRPRDATDQYSASEMSDGERAIFYLIGQTLLADENTLLIIDEPELHVHRSIMSRLWDELEAARADCAFVFITHDLEFAASRAADKYVIRDYLPASGWTIEAVPEETGFDEEITTLILGSRKPVLFVEGDQGSLDIAFYRACYPDWTVIPRGGCQSVIHSVSSMRSNAAFTRISCAGLIDADGRDASERARLTDIGVSVLPVAEIENLLLLPQVSRIILEKNDFSGVELETKLAEVKAAVFAEASEPKNVAEVVLGYCRRRIDQMLKRIDFSTDKSIEDLAASYVMQAGALDVTAIAAEVAKTIADAIADDDLPALLAIYDRKKPLMALAARLRAGNVNEFTRWVTRAIQSKDDNRLRIAVENVLPTPSAA